MNPITLELMTNYRYPSALEARNNKLYYVETIADMDNNDYKQCYHCLDPKTSYDTVIVPFQKRVSVTHLKDHMLIRKIEKSDFIQSNFSYLSEDGTTKDAFSLPLAVNSIKDLNDEYYLVEATIHLECANYHQYTDEQKKAYHEHVKDEEDYLVLDEYPFFFNGAGFINGTRNNLFLVNKKDFTIKKITNDTMDVESVEIKDDMVYFVGNDYESMKTMFASIYQYDVKQNTLTKIYDNKQYFIRKCIFVKDQLFVVAGIKTCIEGQSFLTLEDGKLTQVLKTPYMLHSSIGSDCHYGRGHFMVYHDGYPYFSTTDNERSIIIKFDGKEITKITDGEGSVDDFVFIDDTLYTLASKNMKLQEVYEGTQFKQITSLNEDILKNRYVAIPEKVTCFNVDEIVGFVLKPINYDPNKKYPMILDIHGGPKTAYGQVFYHEMQLWASRGYFVAFCNPHCSDGKGDDFADYLKHYGATDYDDIMKFVDAVCEAYPAIDTQRLGVTGGSYGGYMTNWIITHTDRFKVAASQRSISNRVADFYYSDYSYDTTYENGIPLDEKAIELFWDRSPLKYVENAVTPTLFIQSTQDYRCPFPEPLQLFSALKWKGVDTRICGFKGENHELSRSGKPKHRLRRLKEITDWITKYIG